MNPIFFNEIQFSNWIKTIGQCSAILKLNFISYPKNIIIQEYYKASHSYFRTLYRNIKWINNVQVISSKEIIINNFLQINTTDSTMVNNNKKLETFLFENGLKESEFKEFLLCQSLLFKELEKMIKKDLSRIDNILISDYETVS